mmetsp:Transcript_3916/g.12771  ORF Transcript_3916/g.12771 Transcript_3916/m.12771 type:complete len:147 (+) Transcript_3916:851-1291(+)
MTLRRELFEDVSTNARFLRDVADEAETAAAAARADAKEEGKSDAECDAAARDAERDTTEKMITVEENAAVKDLKYLVTREPNDNDPCQWRRPAVEEIVRALQQGGIEPDAIELPTFSVQILMASLSDIKQDIATAVIMLNRESKLS